MDEFLGLNGFGQVHPDEVGEVRRRFDGVLKEPGASLGLETRLRHKDGSWRRVESRATNLLEEPTVRAVVWNFRDVTDRKLADEEARRKQEELTDFVENAAVGLHRVGPDGTIVWANRAELDLLGYAREEYVGRNIAEFHADPPVTADAPRGLSANGDPHSYEARLRCKDGSIRHVLVSPGPHAKDGGFVLTRDVTERKRLEEEFFRQREYWRVALSSIGDATIRTGPDGLVSFMTVAESLCGWPAADAAGKPLRDVFRIANQRPRQPAESPVEKVPRQGRVVGLANHTVLIARDGKETPIDDSAAPIIDQSGEIAGVVLVFRDVTEKKQAEELRERLAAIVDSSDDVIISKTLGGLITSWNRGAERTLGYTADEVIGKHVSMLMPPELVEDMPGILGRIRRGEKVDHYETRRVRKDGTVVDVSLTVSPIRDASGRIIGASKIGRDVTQEKRIEAERREADRRKDEFLAMLAQELRNSLSAIKNAAQLFGKLATEEDLVWAKEVVQRQVKHLSRLIDDLLDVSRISRGKIGLRKEPLNLSPVVSSAVEAARPLMEDRKHELSVSLINGGLRLEADPVRLAQILVNLLTNAAKYTEAGGKISLTAKHEGNDVVIHVRDTGMGIAPELMPRVFDLFAQGDRTMARSEGGLGIGLTLVRKLCEMHGGTVTAASEGPGKGSEFTVRLPALEEPAARKPGPPGALPRVAHQSSRVLVVDDSLDNARGLSRLLKLLGHDVRVAHDGKEAIEAARAYRPEIVLLDIGRPGMDGYEVARRLRQDECCRGSLVIAVSCYGQPEDLRRSAAAGFDHHLTKPVDYDALMTLFAPRPG